VPSSASSAAQCSDEWPPRRPAARTVFRVTAILELHVAVLAGLTCVEIARLCARRQRDGQRWPLPRLLAWYTSFTGPYFAKRSLMSSGLRALRDAPLSTFSRHLAAELSPRTSARNRQPKRGPRRALRDSRRVYSSPFCPRSRSRLESRPPRSLRPRSPRSRSPRSRSAPLLRLRLRRRPALRERSRDIVGGVVDHRPMAAYLGFPLVNARHPPFRDTWTLRPASEFRPQKPRAMDDPSVSQATMDELEAAERAKPASFLQSSLMDDMDEVRARAASRIVRGVRQAYTCRARSGPTSTCWSRAPLRMPSSRSTSARSTCGRCVCERGYRHATQLADTSAEADLRPSPQRRRYHRPARSGVQGEGVLSLPAARGPPNVPYSGRRPPRAASLSRRGPPRRGTASAAAPRRSTRRSVRRRPASAAASPAAASGHTKSETRGHRAGTLKPTDVTLFLRKHGVSTMEVGAALVACADQAGRPVLRRSTTPSLALTPPDPRRRRSARLLLSRHRRARARRRPRPPTPRRPWWSGTC
jgi:hypothetical protein